jgi:Family of unknown function (DUF5723)
MNSPCKILVTALVILQGWVNLWSQDQLGIAGSTRSPINTVWNNPSTIVDSRAFMDIELVGLDVFARNDLAYLEGKTFSFATVQNTTMPEFNKREKKYHVYADAHVHGPSIAFAVKQHAFALSTSVRVMSDVRGLPGEITDYIPDGLRVPDQMGIVKQVKDVRMHGLAWGEIGLTYGTIIHRDGNAIWQLGVTAKRLLGAAGVGLRLDDWTYVVRDSTHLETSIFRGEYGFNDPSQGPILSGKGWGGDVGITYKMRKSESSGYKPHSPCTDGDFLFRIGAALLDIGRIKFTGPFYRNIFNQSEGSQWENYAGSETDDVADLDSLINSNFNLVKQNGDEQKFLMKLPTAFSAFIDYNLTHHFYIYGTITAGLPRRNSLGVQRASYVGLVPRWEKKRIEIAAPLSLYEWKHPQVGLCFRFNSIIIGSDNLGWWMFNQDIYGADIYVSLKYTIFRHPKCKVKKDKPEPNIRRRGSREAVPCPAW